MHQAPQRLLLLALLLTSGKEAMSQAYDGLTLFQPNNSSTAYLINMDGSVHHSWAGPASPGLSVYLLPDGDLLRTLRVGSGPGGTGGAVERVSWDGVLEWQFEYNQPNQYLQHHDIELLPNGNILMVAWDYRPEAEAVAEGRIRMSDTALSALWDGTGPKGDALATVGPYQEAKKKQK